MNHSQNPLQTFYNVRGILSWTTPQQVQVTLRSAMIHWHGHKDRSEPEPDHGHHRGDDARLSGERSG